MSSVVFSRNRLLVGRRKKDWNKIWLQPDMDELKASPEGEAEIMLYQSATGEPGLREPMNGEVNW